MPLVSTCSAAISAACHRPQEDVDAHLFPVKWGVVTAEGEKPARCAFTTWRGVREPKANEELVGLLNSDSKIATKEWGLKRIVGNISFRTQYRPIAAHV